MFTFPKADKLCGQMRIQHLYQHGHKLVAWPLRMTCLQSDKPTQVLIWAPKSLFKHAVDRNRLRRLMREAWRLGSKPEGQYELAINYMDKQIQPYPVIERAMKKLVRKLNETNPS